jgi:iron(III) transport system substrate-binding protein
MISDHSFSRRLLPGALAVILSVGLVSGLGERAAAQDKKPPTWLAQLDPKLVEAAKKEGQLVIYSSTNESEGLPWFKMFEADTGIKVSYIRGSDVQLHSRIAIEHRAKQKAWDVVQTASVQQIPADVIAQYDAPEAKNIRPSARANDQRWYGVYTNYNTPAYNTKFVKPEELPKTYAEFAKRPQWAGKVVIDGNDEQWLATLHSHFGPAEAKRMMEEIVSVVKPVVIQGHLAAARAVGSGEYWIALNNYLNLTLNVKLAGQPTDFWVLDPVSQQYGQLGISSNAPSPNAARVAANFMLSRESQQFLAKFGRLPTRDDVETNPKGVLEPVMKAKVITTMLTPEDGRKWSKVFDETFRKR